MANSFKKVAVKLERLTDIDLWLIFEKGITAGICHPIYWYVETNKKHKEDYDLDKISSFLCTGMQMICTNSICYIIYW